MLSRNHGKCKYIYYSASREVAITSFIIEDVNLRVYSWHREVVSNSVHHTTVVLYLCAQLFWHNELES